MLDVAEQIRSSFDDTTAICPEDEMPPPAVVGYSKLKRVVDIVLSGVLLALLWPVLLALAILVKLDSRGPAFFCQKRTGLDLKTFTIIKFRSMTFYRVDDCTPAQPMDSRITRFGAVLRRTSLDELPQLVNVFLGQMSLVGPRPHAVAHDYVYGAAIDQYNQRFRTRPGITGLAQVRNLRGGGELISIRERLMSDLEYIDNWSLTLDLKILLATLPNLLTSRAY